LGPARRPAELQRSIPAGLCDPVTGRVHFEAGVEESGGLYFAG